MIRQIIPPLCLLLQKLLSLLVELVDNEVPFDNSIIYPPLVPVDIHVANL